MTRATTKQALIEASQVNYEKLTELILGLSQKEREAIFLFDLEKEKGAHWERDQNIRDVLVHLYEWHQLLIHWVTMNQMGNAKSFLPPGYNWRTYGEMNVEFWRRHQETSFEEALLLLEESHEEVMVLLAGISAEELFLKGAYPWVGGTTLGSYFVSATGSHYNWALKKIRKDQKNKKSRKMDLNPKM